jgi:hypothetical protein
MFAAYTGARRSEIIRSQPSDFKFDAGMVQIREKKRDKGRELTFRHVPMPPAFRDLMKVWLAAHPDAEATICAAGGRPVSEQMTNHHFKDALDGTKWQDLAGWHCFRHSFASNCAMRGVDPRVLDRWLGHQTEEMRKHYLHLFPNHQQDEINRVFSACASGVAALEPSQRQQAFEVFGTHGRLPEDLVAVPAEGPIAEVGVHGLGPFKQTEGAEPREESLPADVRRNPAVEPILVLPVPDDAREVHATYPGDGAASRPR